VTLVIMDTLIVVFTYLLTYNFVLHVLLQAYKLQWQRLTGEFKDVTQRYSTVQKVLSGCLWL